jgi:mannose-1-phosphate guanylyltransferase
MRALLLAGGFGTRLRPITDTIPKCLVPIQGRPLLDYWLELLERAGVERVLINTHYLAGPVEAFVRASRHRDRIELTHETELLGTGGTVLANRAFFRGEDFIVAHADNLTDLDVAAVLRAHAARPADTVMTMVAFRAADPRSAGILGLDRERRLVAFHEKVENPPGDLANAAVYVMTPAVLEVLAGFGKPVIDLSLEVIPRLMPAIYVHEIGDVLIDIGTPAALERANATFAARSAPA